MRAKKLLTSRQIFRYAVAARTVTKSTGSLCWTHSVVTKCVIVYAYSSIIATHDDSRISRCIPLACYHDILRPNRKEGYCNEHVCLSVCPPAGISQKPHIQTSPRFFLCMLPVAVALPSSEMNYTKEQTSSTQIHTHVVIRYVLSVL